MADEPLYYVHADGRSVYKRPEKTDKGTALGFLVCMCNEDIEGAAEEIARCLNRLPQAEALLVETAATINTQIENYIALVGTEKAAAALGADIIDMAMKIENWMVGE